MLRTVLLPAIISSMLVLLTIRISQHFDIVARPTSRGVHTQPTPRLGGVGAAFAFFIVAALLPVWYGSSYELLTPWFAALVLGGAWALVGGALDDVYELPPRWKLLLQIAPALTPLVVGYAPQNFSIPILGNFHMPSVVGYTICTLFIMLMMNAVNFLDGMDGHAALFGVMTAMALGTFVMGFGFDGRFGVIALCFALAGSQIGLLYYNLPGRPIQTKTFMGDSGSQFLGYSLAMLAMGAADGMPHSQFPLLGSLLLFSPFVYDMAYTAYKRWRRGEDLRQAHKEHLYQRLMVAGWSHGRTLAFCAGMIWIGIILISFWYGWAAIHGEVGLQVGMIIIAAFVLWCYTYIVRHVEATEGSKRQASNA